ncbi:hypothetical protein [Cereibacter johrii]|uniref:hypothetical protein n=1 Tax=Cereibacter johrii TaxID=445629 RepID=UPI00195FDEC4|nr:hypothetical protein [Cereibacter johrii]
MDAERTSIAETCLHAAHDGSLSFPEIVGKLIAPRIEDYTVNYSRNTQTFYLPDGDSLVLDMPQQAMSPSRPLSMEPSWNAWSAGRRPTVPTTAMRSSAKRRGRLVARAISFRSLAGACSISAARPKSASSISRAERT